MDRKLTLDVGALCVESFQPASAPDVRGTVAAHEMISNGANTCYCTSKLIGCFCTEQC